MAASAESTFAQTPIGSPQHVLFGLDLDRHGDLAGAEAEFTLAIRANASDVAAFVDRGNVRVRLGAYEEAVRDYDEALRLAPREPAAYLGRANALRKEGDLKDADADYTHAIQAHTSGPYVDALLGRALERDERDDVSMALLDYEAVLAVDAHNRVARQNLEALRAADSRRFRGNTSIDDAVASNSRGISAAAQGRIEDAIRAFSSAFDADPQPAYLRNLATALSRAGRVTEALAVWSRLVAIGTLDLDDLRGRAIVYERLGDVSRAHDDFKVIVSVAERRGDVAAAAFARAELERLSKDVGTAKHLR